jgi:hypothetical protein
MIVLEIVFKIDLLKFDESKRGGFVTIQPKLNDQLQESILVKKTPLIICKTDAFEDQIVRVVSFPGCQKREICTSRIIRCVHITGLMMIDRFFVHGSSGGAVLNTNNELIGILKSSSELEKKTFSESAKYFCDKIRYCVYLIVIKFFL